MVSKVQQVLLETKDQMVIKGRKVQQETRGQTVIRV
jgi:hypothetical protein